MERDLGLAPGTVSRAYRELETTGVISARGRHGSYIDNDAHERASRLRRAAADYAQLASQLCASPREAILALQEVTATSRPAG
jgi:DNA-binding transcriptional regulator YhcF (GntR family)